VLHLRTDKAAAFDVEIDFLGAGDWAPYERIECPGYRFHTFPSGFSAHWVRLTPQADCTASAEFIYT
jgi:hypothetical protein